MTGLQGLESQEGVQFWDNFGLPAPIPVDSMKKLALALASLAFALLAGCDKPGSSADPPPDMRVVAGDGSVTITWTADPDVEYWIFYRPGSTIDLANWSTTGGIAITGATSPRIITGLANGREYAFTMNGRKEKGPGGAAAPTQVVVPVLAGENWRPDAPVGTTRLTSIASGVVLPGYSSVIVGDGGSLYSSVQGTAPTARTNPAAPIDLLGVCYGSYGFLATGREGVLVTSLDSLAWTRQTSGTTAVLNSCAASITGVYVGVGAAGTVVQSTNGNTTWVTPNTGVTADLYGVINGNLRFVAVGAGGTVMASGDGGSWEVITSGTTNDLRAVTYGVVAAADGTTANLYVAVGNSGTVLTSPDTLTWTVLPPFTSANLLGVTYGGRFVAVGAGGVIFTSLNGVNWEARSSGTTADLTSVTRQLLGYTAVGAAGTSVSTY